MKPNRGRQTRGQGMFATEITTPRLMLEPLVPAHADFLFSGLVDDEIYEFIDANPPSSVDVLRRQYERLSHGSSPDGHEIWLNWAVRLRGFDQYVGFVQATITPDQTATVAYVFFREHWHQGYGREAVTAMMNELSAVHYISRFCATVDPRNIRSVALLESLDFHRIEVRIDGGTIRGVPADEIVYEKVRS